MNLQLSQNTALPFQFDAPRHSGRAGTQYSAADIFGVDARRPVVSTPLGRHVARLLAWLSNMPRRARQRAELARLTERDLADMGLTTADIGSVHNPRFAADHAAGRAVRTSMQWL